MIFGVLLLVIYDILRPARRSRLTRIVTRINVESTRHMASVENLLVEPG